VTLAREGWEPGIGDAAREPKGDGPPSLPEVPNSSSIEIRRRVRGRNVEAAGVELVLDEEDPLVGCMAFGSRAELVKEELHRTGGGTGREGAFGREDRSLAHSRGAGRVCMPGVVSVY
jgi:hypothetical protein